MTPMFFDVSEAARVAHVGESKIRAEIKNGKLLARRFGKKILVEPADLQAWRDALPRFKVEAAA
jgi:excisionase family DNA binding protein